jgi:hypothetical protein
MDCIWGGSCTFYGGKNCEACEVNSEYFAQEEMLKQEEIREEEEMWLRLTYAYGEED